MSQFEIVRGTLCGNCLRRLGECKCDSREILSNKGIVCPYCLEVLDPVNYFEVAYDEDTEEAQCHICDKEFGLYVSISYSWKTKVKVKKK